MQVTSLRHTNGGRSNTAQKMSRRLQNTLLHSLTPSFSHAYTSTGILQSVKVLHDNISVTGEGD